MILKASTVDRIRASWIGSEVEQYAGGCINPWVKAPNASAESPTPVPAARIAVVHSSTNTNERQRNPNPGFLPHT